MDQPFEESATVAHVLTWENETPVAIPFELANVPANASDIAVETWSQGDFVAVKSGADVVPGSSSYSMSLQQFASFPALHCRSANASFGSTSAGRWECGSTPISAPLAFDPTRLANFEAIVTEGTLRVEANQLTAGQSGDAVVLTVGWEAEDGIPTLWSVYQDPSTTGACALPVMPAALSGYRFEPVLELVTSSWVVHRDQLKLAGFEDAVAAGVPFSSWNDDESVRNTNPVD